MKSNRKLKGIIIAIIITIASIFIYKGTITPKLYDKYLNEGIKYLMDEQYEEAILAFDKAIKIETKSTEARVYQSKAYIGNEELDKAVEVLEEAQQIDITNEELLKEILEILNEIDSDIAYEFLDRFIEAVGKDSISEEIKEILNSAYDSPTNPIADPAPGTYIKPVSVKLKLDEIKVGHSFYYTTDGSEPSRSAQKYREKINIDKTTTIKLIGYNQNDESTEVITLDYIIDTNIINEIQNSINESENLVNNTEVGTNVGNCISGSKEELTTVIEEVKNLLNNDLIKYEDALSIRKQINNAIEIFKDKIIEETNKSELKNTISKAESIYNRASEGTKAGQYTVGSKSILKDAINKANNVYNNILSKQNDINNEISVLKKAISNFENKKIEEKKDFTPQMALKYIDSVDHAAHDKLELTHDIDNQVKVENGLRYYVVTCGIDQTGLGAFFKVYENKKVVYVSDFSN